MLRLVGQLCDKQMRNKKYNSIEAFMYFHKRFSTSNKELNLCQVLLLNKHILCFTSDLADKLTRFEQIFNDDHVSTSPKLPRCASAVAKSAAHLKLPGLSLQVTRGQTPGARGDLSVPFDV